MKKDKKWLKEQLSYLQDGVGESFNDYSKGLNSAYNTLELLIDQLEEPGQEKVVINEAMAGHIENCKNMKLTLSDSLHLVVPGDKQKEVLFARAWLDGYTVEKEKLYRVRLPMTVWDEESSELQEHWYYLVYDNTSDETRLTQSLRAYDRYQHYQTDLSETSIKSIDERYWAFAEEITK